MPGPRLFVGWAVWAWFILLATKFIQFGGIMGSREVSPGDVVGRTTKLSSLVDIDPVKVEFRVPERFLGQLKEGQSIQFGVPAYPGEVFKGGH